MSEDSIKTFRADRPYDWFLVPPENETIPCVNPGVVFQIVKNKDHISGHIRVFREPNAVLWVRGGKTSEESIKVKAVVLIGDSHHDFRGSCHFEGRLPIFTPRGPRGTRTHDLRIKSPLLYQLS